MKNRQPFLIFSFICVAFLIFSFSIYLKPIPAINTKKTMELAKVGEGKLVWQKYNCQSCHQIYGLGGYLGPDLTNCISKEGKGELYVKAMVAVGTNQMPGFALTNDELEKLLCFLKALDQTGISDPRQFTTYNNGMIEQNEKH